MTYEDGLLHHVENCEYCKYIDEHGHPEECDGCDHPWHSGPCPVEDRGDVADERYKGGTVAIGPCPCEGSDVMTRQQVEDEQNRHARDEDEAAYDKAMDQKLAEWKERER